MDGKFWAYKAIDPVDAGLEFALICGAIDYEFPFRDWRLFPVAEAERHELTRLGLAKVHDQARRTLARVLYQARANAYFKIDELSAKLGNVPLRPMFEAQSRSRSSIQRDKTERAEIMRLVYSKEGAKRRPKRK